MNMNIKNKDKDMESMIKVLNAFKKPNYLRQYEQVEQIAQTLVSFDKSYDCRYAQSVAILEFADNNDNNINPNIQYYYDIETEVLKLNNFDEKQDEFQKCDIKDLLSAYDKIKYIKSENIQEQYRNFYLNNDELISTNGFCIAKSKLHHSTNVQATLTKHIFTMLQRLLKLKVDIGYIAVINNILYIKVKYKDYTIKIASHQLVNYFTYQTYFDAQHKYTLTCNFNEYYEIFSNINSYIKERNSIGYSTCLTKNNIYLMKNDEPIYCQEIITKLPPKFIIDFNQNYILKFLKSNKKINSFEMSVNDKDSSIRIDFGETVYLLMPRKIYDSRLLFQELESYKTTSKEI